MKNIRIIPRLDIKGPNVVKGIHTEGLRVVGNPRELAWRYYQEGADEIIYQDIVASLYQRNLDFDLLKQVCDGIFIPFTVGGGIRSINDISNALRAGADKVAINTYAVHHPELLREAVHKFGAQCIALLIEAKRQPNGSWEAYTDGGREHSGIDAIAWAKQAIELGVGEILVTSIDREGTRKGYEYELIRAIGAGAAIPIVAHGGAGSLESIKGVITDAQADAVAVASIFQYQDYTINQVKDYLISQGINVRRVE